MPPEEQKIVYAGKDFTDISSEEVREYVLSNKAYVKIENPLGIAVSDTGGHRIFNATHAYYIQPREGWFISWKRRQVVEINEETQDRTVIWTADPFVM